jgi:MFS family permease
VATVFDAAWLEAAVHAQVQEFECVHHRNNIACRLYCTFTCNSSISFAKQRQDMFLYGVIVPVLPFALETRSHVEKKRVQYWTSVLIAIYGAALLAFSPVCGYLADRGASRRSPLLLGLFALLGSTVLLNVGNSVGIVIAGRILQGASAAVV